MISVIVPIYNVERFLPKCLESITKQTYGDLEIILVDDGSTDNSGNICDEWKMKDKRITVIHQKNKGLSGARNTGLEIASGEYVSFIDSDDFILPEYFEYLLKLCIDNKSDMSVCQLLEVDEKDKIIKQKCIKESYTIEGKHECMKEFLTTNSIDTTAWRKLYQIDLFRKTGIRYPLGVYHEDVFTTYRIVGLCDKIAVGERSLYAYRKRAGSIINSSFKSKHLDGVKGKLERLNYINKNYPELVKDAILGIIYSANQCVIRIAHSANDTSAAQTYLQKIYREYASVYLKSKSVFYKKLFVILSYVNLKAFILLLKLFSRKSKSN